MPHPFVKGLIAVIIAVPIVYLFVKRRCNRTRFYFLRFESSGCQECFVRKKPCTLKTCSYRTMQPVFNFVSSAQKSLLICSPLIRSKFMTDAIIQAYNRNVHVRVITSKVESLIEFCAHGIPVKGHDCNKGCYLLHNKVIIIDGKILIKSSLNFSDSFLGGNCENLQIIFDKEIILWYQSLFEEIWQYKVPCLKCNSDSQDFTVSL